MSLGKSIGLLFLILLSLSSCTNPVNTPTFTLTATQRVITDTPLPTDTSTPSPTATSTITAMPTQSLEEIMASVRLDPERVTIYGIYKGCPIEEYTDIESFPSTCVDAGQRSGDFLTFDQLTRYEVIRLVISNQSGAIPEEFFTHVILQIFKYELIGDYSQANSLMDINLQGLNVTGDIDGNDLRGLGYSTFHLKLASQIDGKGYWEDSIYFYVPAPTAIST